MTDTQQPQNHPTTAEGMGVLDICCTRGHVLAKAMKLHRQDPTRLEWAGSKYGDTTLHREGVIELESDGMPYRELLNAGVVAIPSNRDAVITDVKGMDDFEARLDAVIAASHLGESETVRWVRKAAGGDSALIQAIHDAASHLGAECLCAFEHVESDADATKAAALLLRVKALANA